MIKVGKNRTIQKYREFTLREIYMIVQNGISDKFTVGSYVKYYHIKKPINFPKR